MEIIRKKGHSYYPGPILIKMPSGTIKFVNREIGEWDKVFLPSGIHFEICPSSNGFSLPIDPDEYESIEYVMGCPGSALDSYTTKEMANQDLATISEYMIERWQDVLKSTKAVNKK